VRINTSNIVYEGRKDNGTQHVRNVTLMHHDAQQVDAHACDTTPASNVSTSSHVVEVACASCEQQWVVHDVEKQMQPARLEVQQEMRTPHLHLGEREATEVHSQL
jgi:hypothetical protein